MTDQHRSLSYSEVSVALDCMARWDFRYGGHLAGDALKSKVTAPMLSEGRAWGRGMATFHGSVDRLTARQDAREAIAESVDQDLMEQYMAGLDVDHVAAFLMVHRLVLLLEHYAATAEELPLDSPEMELDVPIPSRGGKRASTRYRLVAYLDGVHRDAAGRNWLAEFKLRRTLSTFEQVALSRQIRWYAWAWQKKHGEPVAGVIVDETWNEVPKPARMVKGRKKDEGLVPSHAKDQLCTPDDYIAACVAAEVPVAAETLAHLKGRAWSTRHRIIFRPGELEQAARELTAAAKIIQGLDSGNIEPIRNPKPYHCRACDFRAICAHPEERGLVDMLFARTVPKRDKGKVEEPAPKEALPF